MPETEEQARAAQSESDDVVTQSLSDRIISGYKENQDTRPLPARMCDVKFDLETELPDDMNETLDEVFDEYKQRLINFHGEGIVCSAACNDCGGSLVWADQQLGMGPRIITLTSGCQCSDEEIVEKLRDITDDLIAQINDGRATDTLWIEGSDNNE